MNAILDRVGSIRETLESAGTAARWEWRTFPMLPIIGRLFEFITDAAESPIAETYVLSSLTAHQVKVRNGRLAVKRLERMNDCGLELWQPVLDAAFPIEWPAIECVSAALGITPPVALCELETVDDFLGDLVRSAAGLRTVSLIKRRTPLRALGCHGEFVELAVGSRHFESVAFDDQSPDRVKSALSYLGLVSKPNINYPAALKRIIGMGKAAAAPVG